MKTQIQAFDILDRIRKEKPVIHHLTNWVTIYDCAQVVKTLGASPVMAHAREEVAEMAAIASALVLNIGTLALEFVEAMKLAARSANEKGIPVVLDVCGAGATKFRDHKCLELLNEVRISIVKGNASEIARIAGESVKTRGVDAAEIKQDLIELAGRLSRERRCIVAVTGKEDIITDGHTTYLVANGHPMMPHVVGTGCMAASVIATFAAVEKDLALAAASGLVCFGVAAELAAQKAKGPAAFKAELFDRLYQLDKKTIERMQAVTFC